MDLKKIARTAAFLAAALALTTGASAATEKEFSTAVNLAGRQRMLSQKMAKDTFLSRLGVAKAEAAADLEKTMALFSATFDGLSKGDAGLGLPPPPNDKIKAQLAVVGGKWSEYKKALKDPASGIPALSALSDSILTELDRATKMYEKAAEDAGIGGSGLTVNVAGRQRMLSQKMAKQICLVALDSDKAENLEKLKTIEALFENSHRGLVEGDEVMGLKPTSDAGIKAQMQKVGGIWARYKAVIDGVQTKGSADAAAAQKAFELSNELLPEMNKAVESYAAAKDGKASKS